MDALEAAEARLVQQHKDFVECNNISRRKLEAAQSRLAELLEKKSAHASGDYSCVTCGPGLTACEHWRNLIEASELEKQEGK